MEPFSSLSDEDLFDRAAMYRMHGETPPVHFIVEFARRGLIYPNTT